MFMKKLKMTKELILLCAPQYESYYYKDIYIDILKFQINFANLISGKNHCIVLADNDTVPYLTGGHPELIRDSIPRQNILPANIADIWIRDFGTVRQNNPVAFKFQPMYHKLSKQESGEIQEGFFNFLKWAGIQIVKKSLTNVEEEKSEENKLSIKYYPEINLDGGNVVDDLYNNNAIITDRIFQENKIFKDKESAKTILQKVLGLQNVVIMTQYGDMEEDTTGHADLRVSFIDENTVAFGKIENDKQLKLVSELKAGLGESVKLVELPSYHFKEKSFDLFTSGCGCHTNSLVTRNFIYMPTFGDDPESQAKGYTVKNDEEVYEIVRNNTSKQVVKVPVPHKIGVLGGSVRCLSMQLEGEIAEHLISLANKQ